MLEGSLVAHPSRNLEDSSAGTLWTMEGQLKSSEGTSVRNWAADCSCDVFAKDVAAFCPYPKNVPEAKLKSTGL